MITEALSEELYHFFNRYLAFYREFLQLETDKCADMACNNLSALPNHVKTEEVYMLKSKGLENERNKLVAKTGLTQPTFQQLIPLLDESTREKVHAIYDELSHVLLDLKAMNLRCNTITELRLHKIETQVRKLEKRPELDKIYTAHAYDRKKSGSILSTKI